MSRDPVDSPQSRVVPLAPAAGHGSSSPPSDWVLRWQHLLAPGQRALDLACGGGRHVRWLAGRGLTVTAVDRDGAALAELAGVAGVTTLVADLESAAWPLAGLRFELVLVTNYLWRPLVPALIEAVAPGGLLIYETFALGQETVGRPSNPQFLLAPGELLTWVSPDLQVLGYEDGWSADQPLRRVQHIVARRPEVLTTAACPGPGASTTAWPLHLSLPPGAAHRGP